MFWAADVLVVSAPGAVVAVYANYAALGLNANDDIDALIVVNDNVDDLAGGGDNGQLVYEPGMGDRILFSLRRFSPSLGMICPVTGLPITEADVLAPGPRIVIPGEALGLFVNRNNPPFTYSDDLDALDAYFARQYPAAQDDDGNVGQGGQVEIDVLANDLAPYGEIEAASVRILRSPEHGSIVGINPATGVILYEHDGSDSDSDLFQYVVFDTDGSVSDPTSVMIAVETTADVSSDEWANAYFRVAGANLRDGGTALEFAVNQSGLVRIDVFDSAGRRVRALFHGHAKASEPYGVRWDGRNAAGRPVSSGVFYARLSSASEVRQVKFTRIR
jgi:hypothetical protein